MATLGDILARNGETVIAVRPADTVLHATVMNEEGIGVATIDDILAYQVGEQQATIAQMTSYLFDVR